MKSNDIESFLENSAETFFGHSRSANMAASKCVACGQIATNFRDKLSIVEYSISGFCQKCQDEVFEEKE